jgi:hypothetical protein
MRVVKEWLKTTEVGGLPVCWGVWGGSWGLSQETAVANKSAANEKALKFVIKLMITGE